MERILVSSCLLGIPIRYDGSDAKSSSHLLAQWLAEGRIISFCPELAAGLPVPRPPVEILLGEGEDVLMGRSKAYDIHGADVTQAYLSGAEQALHLARIHGITIALLKDGSPSCGTSYIYDGTFSDQKQYGLSGITSAILRREGIRVFSETQLEQVAKCINELEAPVLSSNPAC